MLTKADYDFINLGVCIKGQADRLGIEHEGVPLEGVVVRIAERALELQRAANDADSLPWEYSPGHPWTDRDGIEHWFVQSGLIRPGYVAEYIAEGGEVVRRRVGPYETVSASDLPAEMTEQGGED